MKREDVYKALDSEREYQDKETKNPLRPDMIEDFRIAGGLGAIKVNLDKAYAVWYTEGPDYQNTMEFLRKIGGLCVKMGEKYGMKKRDLI